MTAESITLPPRNEVPVEETWDLHSIFATDADWEAAGKTLLERLPTLAAFKGRLSEGPQVLLEYVTLFQETAELIGKIGTYASNDYAVDTNNQAAAARAGQARSLMSRFAAAVSFANPELMQIGFERLRQWTQQEPKLAFLAHYFDQLERRKEHVRSDEVEEVLALTGDPFSGPYSVYSALNSADLTFRPAKASDGTPMDVGQSSIGSLLSHADREVRRTAWESYNDSYLGFKNTYTATLTAAVKQDVFNARARRYESSLHAA
ncbi:MAG: hypothetical protein JXB38_18935, partial [Anaerolineales bacterium]|nr:hypothetical protein [Anaerolineales bacterium]